MFICMGYIDGLECEIVCRFVFSHHCFLLALYICCKTRNIASVKPGPSSFFQPTEDDVPFLILELTVDEFMSLNEVNKIV